ncbi:MAG: hypothetical protein U0003_02540 [Vampirovibrionales bacterium]
MLNPSLTPVAPAFGVVLKTIRLEGQNPWQKNHAHYPLPPKVAKKRGQHLPAKSIINHWLNHFKKQNAQYFYTERPNGVTIAIVDPETYAHYEAILNNYRRQRYPKALEKAAKLGTSRNTIHTHYPKQPITPKIKQALYEELPQYLHPHIHAAVKEYLLNQPLIDLLHGKLPPWLAGKKKRFAQNA